MRRTCTARNANPISCSARQRPTHLALGYFERDQKRAQILSRPHRSLGGQQLGAARRIITVMNKHEPLSRGELHQGRVSVGESPTTRLKAQREPPSELGRLGTQHRDHPQRIATERSGI